MTNETLLSVQELKRHFDLGKDTTLKAVDGISFDIKRGETFGLVGESGCGKSTAGRTIMGLYSSTDGKVEYDGVDIHKMSDKDRFDYLRNMQMI
ncbi:ABC transporter ATP-binding protein, partial [Streptococcus pneumoniae]|nr:ABC transporter ATP-binding protein [Streptococcus pneumoniae]